MSTIPPNGENADDKRLLRRLLTVPLPQRTLGDKLLTFLSHGAWQGFGALLGLVSLVVSVYLAFLILQLSTDQQTANISAVNSSRYERGNLISNVTIENRGPAAAQSVEIYIGISPVDEMGTQEYIIMMSELESSCDVFMSSVNLEAKLIENGRGRCIYRIERFYPQQSITLYISAQSRMPIKVNASVQGLNVLFTVDKSST